jgi:NRPS condensation-like uncharacterized protein
MCGVTLVQSFMPCHLFDFAVLKVGKKKYYLLTKFHHLVIDGIGMAIFSRFISDKYNSLLSGEEMPPVTNTFRACVDDYFASFDESLYLQDKVYWLKEFERENNEFLIYVTPMPAMSAVISLYR